MLLISVGDRLLGHASPARHVASDAFISQQAPASAGATERAPN